MNVHDAMPGDLYLDESGTLWKCYARCDVPTVYFHSMEGAAHRDEKNPPSMLKSGGVGGYMWNGFKRIHRSEA